MMKSTQITVSTEAVEEHGPREALQLELERLIGSSVVFKLGDSSVRFYRSKGEMRVGFLPVYVQALIAGRLEHEGFSFSLKIPEWALPARAS